MKQLLAIMISGILLVSCGTTKEGNSKGSSTDNADGGSVAITKIKMEDYTSDSLLVRIELGACFGQCPVEKFSIFASGNFTYEGINFVDKKGDFTGKLKSKEVDEIYTMMSNLKIDEYPSKFGLGVSDVSTKAIIFNFNGKRKIIMFKLYDDHSELKEFITRVRGIMGGAKYHPVPTK